MRSVYIPQYEQMSAGSAYISDEELTIRPGEPLRFSGVGDMLNAAFEPGGIIVTQPGLYLICLDVSAAGKSVKLGITSSGIDSPIAEFVGERVSATLVKRLPPDVKIGVVNLTGSDVAVRSAYLSVVQLTEYRTGSFVLGNSG
ncbi:MAG: hypothetical protein LBC65_02215 [Oscillospiraceae bacterium]|jgi:hypothetical protein|nr:hypothetical protein [Oscillospiraceae bacterium]